MGILSISQNRRLLFRSYATIVGSLVLIAAGFDYGYSRLQSREPSEQLAWSNGVLTLIESRLTGMPEGQWAEEAGQIERELGFPVRILPPDLFVQAADPETGTLEIFDSSGRAAFFKRSAALGAGIQIGPLAGAVPDDSLWIRLIPIVFYVSIGIIVSFWIWPLLRDVNTLTAAARGFAADYSTPIEARNKTTVLRELAASFDEMSERIGNLIRNQRELTSALSHEMRTPLARIRFAMAVMSGREKFSEELASIDQDVEEVDRLIRTMLDYARLDQDQTGIDRHDIPVAEWLDRVVQKTVAGQAVPRVDVDVPAVDVSMDPVLMELALSNLLVNARRYAKETVSVSFRADGPHYELAVEDDGPGIPVEERESVLKPFKRLDDSRSRLTGGYGLGLAIVARIATRHGGAVRIESSSLGGARIVIAW